LIAFILTLPVHILIFYFVFIGSSMGEKDVKGGTMPEEFKPVCARPTGGPVGGKVG
jgi:hypothetical protein